MNERINNELGRLLELAKTPDALNDASRHMLRIYEAIAHIAYSIQELEACWRTNDREPSTGPERRELFRIVDDGLKAIAGEMTALDTKKGTP